MLNQLLRLYKKHRTKTPLEDFTTEVFVGLLNLEEDLKESFITEFLELPKDDYRLKTQMQYFLEDDTDCIVDFVIESDNRICFVENKVNSKEGYRQLERYGKVLKSFAENDFETKLFYCTKYFDNKTYKEHEFEQIRWFQIAKFLKPFGENSLVKDFINFLIKHDMAQELTLNATDFLTLENLQNIFKVTNDYLDRVRPVFERTFQSEIKISDARSNKQVLNHNRIIYLFKSILGNVGWTEIKYGFQLNNPSIYVGIWVDKANDQHDAFRDITATLPSDFVIIKRKNGTAIELKKEISVYLNDDEADAKIAEWFKKSFAQFAEFIKANSHLDWKINVA